MAKGRRCVLAHAGLSSPPSARILPTDCTCLIYGVREATGRAGFLSPGPIVYRVTHPAGAAISTAARLAQDRLGTHARVSLGGVVEPSVFR